MGEWVRGAYAPKIIQIHGDRERESMFLGEKVSTR